VAEDINNLGDIVGYAGAATCCLKHAFLWQRGSQPFDLGTLPAPPGAAARAINNLGEIVGQAANIDSQVDDGTSTGFLYANGQMYDLSALIPPTSGLHVFAPYDINDKGQILAEAYNAAKQWYWVVLSPQTPPTAATPVNTSPPQISGLPISGDMLTSTLGSWGGFPATYAIQWMRCSASASDCIDIPGATDSSYLIGSGDVGFTFRVRVTATDEYGSASVQSAATVVVDTPLNGFRPELRYDSQETYRADAAGELTDNCWLDSNGTTHTNSLYDSSGTNVLATGCDQLSLGYLGPSYPSGAATSADSIHEYPDQVNDFQRMHLMSQYGDHVYGRVHTYSDGESILQYWFWYYNQPNFVIHNTFGGHEGDWEGIQIHLDANGNPVDTTYYQHHGGELCGWGRVSTTGSNGLHPLVFVADNSHASYFTTISNQGVGGDSANGLGPQITPSVERIYDGAPAWLFWPGMWGGSTNGTWPDQTSPTGPGEKQDQWNDPLLWQTTNPNISACTVPSSMHAQRNAQTSRRELGVAAATVPAPRVHAHRVGKRAIVRYCFATVPTSRRRRPAVMEVSVQSANKRVPPYTTDSRAHLPCGRVTQPIGLGRAPFHVLVSAWSRTGARSRVVTVLLR
jgi:probable HAF family extracellular repeat protein